MRNFHGNLIGRPADAAALDFQLRTAVFQRAQKKFHRIALFKLFADALNRAVDDALRDRLLAVLHDDVDQLAHQRAVVAGIRLVRILVGSTTTRHVRVPYESEKITCRPSDASRRISNGCGGAFRRRRSPAGRGRCGNARRASPSRARRARAPRCAPAACALRPECRK